MQINLVLRACGSVLQTIKSSSLDQATKEELSAKVNDIAKRAIDPLKADALEQLLHSDECAELGEETAQLALYQRVYREVVGESNQKTRTKMEEVARFFLANPAGPAPSESSRKLKRKPKVHLARYTDQGAVTQFGSKRDLDTERKSPPFNSISTLQAELNRELSPDVEFGGEYQDILQKLAGLGLTTKKDLLGLSHKQLAKKLGFTEHSDIRKVALMRQAVVSSLKSLHQEALEEDLNAFLDSLDSESLSSSSSTPEGFLGSRANQSAFRAFVDQIIEKGYDPSFQLSNSSVESLAEKTSLPQKNIERLIFEARVEAFAQTRLTSFKERASTEEDIETLYTQLLDSLLSNYAAEKGQRIDKEDMAHASLVFQVQVTRIASRVQKGELNKAKALSELKTKFLQAFEDESIHIESLTPEEFEALPAKSLPPALTRQLRKEIQDGTWEREEAKDIEIPNITPEGARRLRENLSIVLTSSQIDEATSTFMESLKG